MYYAPVWATMGNLNRRPWKLELMTRETEPVAMEIEDDRTCTNDDGKLNYRQWSRNRSGLLKIVEGMAVVFLLGHDGQNWARNNILACDNDKATMRQRNVASVTRKNTNTL